MCCLISKNQLFLRIVIFSALAQYTLSQFLGVITCNSIVEDGGFNEMLNKGFLEEQVNRVNMTFEIPERAANNCLKFNDLEQFIIGGVDHIVFNGFDVTRNFAPFVKLALGKYPNVRFTSIDSVPENFDSTWTNMQAVVFREEAAGYVVGYLAGQVSTSKTVGGVFGVPFAPLKRFRNGYLQGVAASCPSCTVVSQYITNFKSPEAGRAVVAYYDSIGADVVFAAAGDTGSGVLLEGARRNISVIGVDNDQYGLFQSFPDLGKFIISSALKPVDEAIREVIFNHFRNEFKGGSTKLINSVEIAPCHEACDRIQAQYAATRKVLQEVRTNPSFIQVDNNSGKIPLHGLYGEELPFDSWSIPEKLFGQDPLSKEGGAVAFVDFYDDRVAFVFGGIDRDAPLGSGDLWSFNVGSMSWQKHFILEGQIAPDNRYFATLVPASQMNPQSLVLFGGNDGDQLLGDTWIFRLPGESTDPLGLWELFKQTGSPAPSAREGHAATVAGEKAYLFGGQDFSKTLQSDLWTFDEQNGWTKLCGPCTPPARAGHTLTASPNGKFLYLHGGSNSDRSKMRDLWSFDIEKQTWLALRDAPTARYQHQALLLRVVSPKGTKAEGLKSALAFVGGELGEGATSKTKKSISYYFLEDAEWIQVSSFSTEVVRKECLLSESAAGGNMGDAEFASGLVEYDPRKSFVAFPGPPEVQQNSTDKIIIFGGRFVSNNQYATKMNIFHPAELPYSEDMNQLSKGTIVGLSMLFAVSGGMAVMLLIWAWRRRNHTVLRSAQFPFLFMVGVGTLIQSATILVIVVDDSGDKNNLSKTREFAPANAACMASVWLFGVGFIFSFAPLFAKMWRVHKIFSDTRLRKITISNRQLVFICFGLLLFECAIILAWQFIDPLVYFRKVIRFDDNGSPLESVGYCTSDTSGVFLFALLVFHVTILMYGNFLSWKARKIDVRFQESRGIAIALVANLQLLALTVPVLVIVAQNPLARTTIMCGVVFLNSISMLGFIFLPKYMMVHSGKYDISTSANGSHEVANRSGFHSTERHGTPTYDEDDTVTSKTFLQEHFSSTIARPPSSKPPMPPFTSSMSEMDIEEDRHRAL